MPIPNDYEFVIDLLAAKTEAGEVVWQDSRSSGYQVDVEGSVLKIWAGQDEVSDEGFVAFALSSNSNETLDSWYVDEREPQYERMRLLFGAAKRNANGVPRRLEKLAEILRKSSTVGTRRQSGGPITGEARMANAFIEPTADGKYQLEIPGENGGQTFSTQKEAIEAAKAMGHTPLVARVRHLNDKAIPDHWRSAD